MQEHPDTRIDGRGKTAASIIAPLESLRDRRRLGIHMWEQRLDYSFPIYANGLFTDADPAPQISASLLPTAADGIGMRPFGCVTDAINRNLGYLVDLDETRANPVQLLGGNERVIKSGNDEFDKQIPNQDRSRTFDEIGEKTASDRELASEDGTNSVASALTCNQIILHAQPEHRRAIVVPDYASATSPRWYNPVRLIIAAMAGIDHQNQGIDLPVVSYDVGNAGHLTYIGRSISDLNKVASNALRELMENPLTMESLKRRWEYKLLVPAVKEHFNIDIEKPAREQRAAFAELGVTAENGRAR